VELESNAEERLSNKTDNLLWFSVAVDESIDMSDATKLSNFFRGVFMEFSITDVLAAIMPVEGPQYVLCI
jgi:hypothetical protein